MNDLLKDLPVVDDTGKFGLIDIERLTTLLNQMVQKGACRKFDDLKPLVIPPIGFRFITNNVVYMVVTHQKHPFRFTAKPIGMYLPLNDITGLEQGKGLVNVPPTPEGGSNAL